MPSVVKIDPLRKLVQSTFYGEVTGEDLLRHRQSIISDSAFEPDFVDLVDFSNVTIPIVDLSALQALAKQGSLFFADSVHVVIVPDEKMYRLALEYRKMATDTRLNLHVVRSLDESRELLNTMGYEL